MLRRDDIKVPDQPETGKVPDSELVGKAVAGDLDAFEELVDRHEKRIYTLAKRIVGSREEAEDVTQQAFLNAMTHLKGFRGESSFATWITAIATNQALKIIRSRKMHPTTSLDAATDQNDETGAIPHPEYIADWRQHPAMLADRNEKQALIEECMAELNENLRTVFLLRDVEGLSVRETAQALEISENNVKVRLLRARMKLREKLNRILGDPAKTLVRPEHDHSDLLKAYAESRVSGVTKDLNRAP